MLGDTQVAVELSLTEKAIVRDVESDTTIASTLTEDHAFDEREQALPESLESTDTVLPEREDDPQEQQQRGKRSRDSGSPQQEAKPKKRARNYRGEELADVSSGYNSDFSLRLSSVPPGTPPPGHWADQTEEHWCDPATTSENCHNCTFVQPWVSSARSLSICSVLISAYKYEQGQRR